MLTSGRIVRGCVAAVVGFVPFLMGQGCPAPIAGGGAAGPSPVQNVTPAEAFALIEDHKGDPNFVILDVRSPEEVGAGHIENSIAVCLLCTDDFAGLMRDADKSKTYLVYCRTGNRSATASRIMATEGFEKIYNMTGGISQWQAQGYPVVR